MSDPVWFVVLAVLTLGCVWLEIASRRAERRIEQREQREQAERLRREMERHE